MMSREEAKRVSEADYRTSLGCDHTGGYASFVYVPPIIPPLPPISYAEALVEKNSSNQVDHPLHYGGASDTYEAIKVIEAWDLDFCLGNTVKYISRAGRKAGNSELQDLQKATWYLQRRIEQLREDGA